MRHSIAWPRDATSVLREAERLAGRDPDARLHEVDAGDELGDRVLDLQARVHLQEVEVRRARRRGTRSCRRRRSRPPRGARRPPSPICARRPASMRRAGVSSITFWCRRCTEQSRSNRWTTLPCESRQDLDLDVARLLDELLDVEGAVAEARLRLAIARARSSGLSSRLVAHEPHALAAAARAGLHASRAGRSPSRRPRPASSVSVSVVPGTIGTPAACIAAARGRLVAHRRDRLGPAAR